MSIAYHCNYFSDGYLQGKLYEVDNYPAAIESNNLEDEIEGHLILRQLDAYEECTNQFPEPHEYSRKKRLITLFDGSSVSAWVYMFNRDVSNLISIQSGDYLQHLNVAKKW